MSERRIRALERQNHSLTVERDRLEDEVARLRRMLEQADLEADFLRGLAVHLSGEDRGPLRKALPGSPTWAAARQRGT
jgi:predicted RNase H-like nuclease (RuvC/YqgF family)